MAEVSNLLGNIIDSTTVMIRVVRFFFEKHSPDADAHKHAHTLIPMNTCTQPYFYEHIRETEPANPRD